VEGLEVSLEASFRSWSVLVGEPLSFRAGSSPLLSRIEVAASTRHMKGFSLSSAEEYAWSSGEEFLEVSSLPVIVEKNKKER
jgi:hypothetical protein